MATARHSTGAEEQGGGWRREREREQRVTPKHYVGIHILTFFIWNLIVALTSSILCIMLSLCVRRVGNFPALLRPGPNSLGICLIKLSDARKASYRLAVLSSVVCVCVCVCVVRVWEKGEGGDRQRHTKQQKYVTVMTLYIPSTSKKSLNHHHPLSNIEREKTTTSTQTPLQCLTQLFDEFLVLVELLEGLNIHAWDTISLGLVTVRGVTQHTHLELRTRNVTKPKK